MKCITKYFKKRRLLAKYRLTSERMENDLYMLRVMGGDVEFKEYYYHVRSCELRCYRRLKKL